MAPFHRRPLFRRPPMNRRAGPGAALAALLLAVALLPAGAPAQPGFRERTLSPPFRVLDGDTFAADLDGDGRIEPPRERVRLLYVDTPELGESRKGRDRRHGLPARDFLERALQRAPVRLRVPVARPRGNHGRTLGMVRAGGEVVNLALVRAGHSYFDTRFSFPRDYHRYAEAEGAAFAAGRGIWDEAASRRRYLERLRDEHKTPRAEENPRYGGGVYPTGQLRLADHVGRYIRARGLLRGVRPLRRGVVVLALAGPGERPLDAVVFPPYAGRLGVKRWERGREVHLEGFVQRYRGRLEIAVHYGRPADR